MAKRKKRKETKKKFDFQVELYGVFIVLVGILGICGYGPCGEFICAFAAFLFGCLYLVFLIGLVLMGLYIIVKKEYPDFWNTKMVGVYILIIGILMVLHMPYLKDGFMSFKDTMITTFRNSMRVFDIISGASRKIAFQNVGGGLIGGFFVSIFKGAAFNHSPYHLYELIFFIASFAIRTSSSVGFEKSSYLTPM